MPTIQSASAGDLTVCHQQFVSHPVAGQNHTPLS